MSRYDDYEARVALVASRTAASRATDTPTPDLPVTRYHWILTAQASPSEIHNLDGVIAAQPGTTRGDVYKWARERAAEEIGHNRFAMLFFDLAPNDLSGGAT
jgi:hypothetical protein